MGVPGPPPTLERAHAELRPPYLTWARRAEDAVRLAVEQKDDRWMRGARIVGLHGVALLTQALWDPVQRDMVLDSEEGFLGGPAAWLEAVQSYDHERDAIYCTSVKVNMLLHGQLPNAFLALGQLRMGALCALKTADVYRQVLGAATGGGPQQQDYWIEYYRYCEGSVQPMVRLGLEGTARELGRRIRLVWEGPAAEAAARVVLHFPAHYARLTVDLVAYLAGGGESGPGQSEGGGGAAAAPVVSAEKVRARLHAQREQLLEAACSDMLTGRVISVDRMALGSLLELAALAAERAGDDGLAAELAGLGPEHYDRKPVAAGSCLGVLGRCAARRGERRAARRLRREAAERVVRGRDALLAVRLLAVPSPDDPDFGEPEDAEERDAEARLLNEAVTLTGRPLEELLQEFREFTAAPGGGGED